MQAGRTFGAGARHALAATLLAGAAHADDGFSSLGADYALLSLMTVSPDFSAARYTIENDDGPDVGIRIGRFPRRFELAASESSRLHLELIVAYQRAEQAIDAFAAEGGSIDSRWDTYGGSIGLLHEKDLPRGFYVASSLRLGITATRNRASYTGFSDDAVRTLLDGTLLNWHLRTRTVEIGLGAGYRLTLGDRTGSVESTLSHALADSFDESDPALAFGESVGLLSTVVDAIRPTGAELLGERLDLVLLGAHHHSFGEDGRTLGYSDSYQLGLGLERPLGPAGGSRRYLRLSAQVLWAERMDGWLVSVSLDPG